jgi:hypothetical protein
VTSPCSNNCSTPEVFPRTINNRPGLSRIAFRIGAYADFRLALFSELDRTQLLLPWTHRKPDDPGIALLEGVAILGDILTFYQELYANEAWLRTATWPESVTALVRLLGYRPAPGIGGESEAAFEFKGATSVTVPAGFGFNARLAGQTKPVDFETSSELAAVPQLSRFSLYDAWTTPPIAHGTTALAVPTSVLIQSGVTLKPKDRLALVDPATVPNPESVNWQIGVVGSVSVELDQTLITLTGSWQGNAPSGGSLMAYKLGRSFHAFGYNAPSTQISISNNVATSTGVNTAIPLPQILNAFPLERKVDDLSAGSAILVDLEITNDSGQTEEFLLATRVYRAYLGADSVGPMSGSVTYVELQTSHVHTGNVVNADRRTAQCLEVIGSGFPVSAERVLTPTTQLDRLSYYGDAANYQKLSDRLLQFVVLNADDSVGRIEQSTATIDAVEPGDSSVGFRTVYLNPALQLFFWNDFPLDVPVVTVFGNVVGVTQGKTQPPATLGNGDARQINQTFQVPKGPLTWLSDEAITPPRKPQIQVLVNNIEWDEVDSLFTAGPRDTRYIIRLDDAGNSWIQFGDGINGARLPSGIGNVLITNRTGVSANGVRTPGTNPAPAGQAQNLTAIRLYEPVTGGAAPETSDGARQTAPRRVQSLGRLVSLSDFEYEALALPGVEKAQATWDLSGGVPLLVLTVLLANPSDAATASVQASLSMANITRGPQRFQVQVISAGVLYVYLNLNFGLTKGYQSADVTSAISIALGVIPVGATDSTGGLFSQDQRQLGEPEYASRIEGVVQNVAGVDWVEVTAFDQLGSLDPSSMVIPTPTTRADQVPCQPNQVLALYAAQFNPSPAKGNSP